MSKASLLRTNPEACPLAVKCGGCQLQNMPYERQLRWKQARVEMLLKRFARPERIVGMRDPQHYRCKVQAAFARTRDGKTVSGVYQSVTHTVVPTDRCMIEDAEATRIVADIRALLPRFQLKVYDARRGTGLLRHVLIRKGKTTGDIMVVLVLRKPDFPQKKAFAAALVQAHPAIRTVVLNVCADERNLVLGERDEVLWGEGYIEDVLCGLTFRLSPRSFYQVNPTQTEKLYALAMEMAALNENTTVIDAYCGVGTMGLIAAKTAGRVIGVELNADAVRDANENARRNGVENITFFGGDAAAFLENAADEDVRADVLLMDPPRVGSSRRFIEAVAKMEPPRVVYVSCNPETLARDLALLAKRGYRVDRICPVDMFPYTKHVECVVSLTRHNALSCGA